jgi:hypothetical protein
VAVLAGLVLSLATVFVPARVHNHTELGAVPFGLPPAYAIQDYRAYDPPDFPRHYRLLGPWENP